MNFSNSKSSLLNDMSVLFTKKNTRWIEMRFHIAFDPIVSGLVHDKLLFCVFCLQIIFHYLSQIWIKKKVKEKKKLIQHALACVFAEKFLSFCLTFCWCSSSVEEFDWHQEELYVILLQVLVFLAREYQFSVSFNSNLLQHPPIDNPWGKRETDLIFLN